MENDWLTIYRQHGGTAAYLVIDESDPLIVGVRRGEVVTQLVAGENLSAQTLRTALDSVSVVVVFDGEAANRLFTQFSGVLSPLTVTLVVRDFAHGLDAPEVAGLLDSLCGTPKFKTSAWHAGRTAILEMRRADAENLAFFAEHLARFAESKN